MKPLIGSQQSHPTLLTLLLLTPFALSITICYNPNKTSSSSTDYEYGLCPYENNGSAMCCALNRTNPSGGSIDNGLTADLCLKNGLCQNIQAQSTGEVTTYFRDLCSTPTWGSEGCLDVCADPSKGGTSNGTQLLTPCDGSAASEYWCCGNSRSCCGTDDQVRINSTFAQNTTATASTSSTSTTSTSPPTATSILSSSTATSAASSGLSSGAKAGIGIGVAVGAIAVLAALVFFFRRKRSTRSPVGYRVPPQPQQIHEIASSAGDTSGDNRALVGSMESRGPRYEMVA